MSRLPRPRAATLVGAAGLLAGVLAGWTAGLVRVHPVSAAGPRR